MKKLRELRCSALHKKLSVLRATSALAIVFALTLVASPTGQAQTFSVIHAFTGADGGNPHAGVTYKAGSFFGTTASGGSGCSGDGCGVVYQMTRVGNNWSTSPIFLFPGVEGGISPQARVVFGSDGHLYGTTFGGGNMNQNTQGNVFKLTPPLSICKTANCFWTENVLYTFDGFQSGGEPGYGDLIWDQQGNIYGTSTEGSENGGVVYELQPSGNSWTEIPIHVFSSIPDGYASFGGVIWGSNGNLFGTTAGGGTHDEGTVFELTYQVGVGWTKTILHSFQLDVDGANPFGGLVSDSSGNLYGSTTADGVAGGGTIFELSPAGDTWTFKLLYNFSGVEHSNCGPFANLTLDAAGNLYGTTRCDGANGLGNVFKLTNTPNGWVYTSLYDLTGGSDGSYPYSNVTFDENGNLYGTAYDGGNFGGSCGQYGCGVVWMIKP